MSEPLCVCPICIGRRASEMYERERALCDLLGCEPGELVGRVKAMLEPKPSGRE